MQTKSGRGGTPPLLFWAVLLSASWLTGGRAQALLLDSGDTTVGYVAETPSGGAAAPTNLAALVQGESNQAVQLNYDFATAGTYSQLTKNFSHANLGDLASAFTALRFYIRGSGPTNTLRIRLTDSDGDQIFKTFNALTGNNAWQIVTIPRTEFTLTVLGNGIFDLFRVTQIEVAVERVQGGSGTLDIDKIEIVTTQTVASTSILLDGFEGGTGSLNQFAGDSKTFNHDANNASISTAYDNSAGNVAIGSYSLKLTYNAGTKLEVENVGYYNTPNGTDLTNATQIEFYAKASNSNESFLVRFGSKTDNQNLNISGIGTSWQKVIIPLNNYDAVITSGTAGRPGKSAVTEFVLVFKPGLSAGSGNVWIDDIRFTRPAVSSGTVLKTVDTMDEPTDLTTWEPAYDAANGSFAKLESIPDGIDGRALRMSYDLKDGAYCTMLRKMYVNAALSDSFRFRYKYSSASDGNNKFNDFELHALDSNGVEYKSKIPNLEPTAGQWKTMTLPLANFQKVSGANLSLKKLKDFRFTLIKNEGGKGVLAIDDFEVLNAPKLTQGAVDRLIQNLSTDNNPFSPNGDGIQDTVTFSYTVKENSNVRLRIYDPKGGVVKEFKPEGLMPAGSHSFIWNGYDTDFNRVRNGLYFFQMTADAPGSGNKDKETNVLAILR